MQELGARRGHKRTRPVEPEPRRAPSAAGRDGDLRELAGAMGNQAFGRWVARSRGTREQALLPSPAAIDTAMSAALARMEADDPRPAAMLLRENGDGGTGDGGTGDGGTKTAAPDGGTLDADPPDAGVGSRPDGGGGVPAVATPTAAPTDGGTAAPDGGAPAADAGTKAAPPCAATATGVSLGTSSSFNDGTRYGLITPIIVRGTNLADVLDSELVGASIDHTGSMASRPSAKSNNSGFQQADSIPDDHHGSGIADHLSYFDNHGGDGSYSRLQMDLYMIPKCAINTPQDMPSSGYRIKREVKKDGAKVKGIVTKTAEAVSIDGHASTAGLTAKREAEVVLR